MSMIFQSYALWPHMTVFENVAYGLRLRNLPRQDVKRRVEGILAVTQARAARGPLPGRAVRRPAAARVAGPRARRRARDPAARRAALQPRRQPARGDALRDPPAARRVPLHHRLRDARPGRGHDDGRPDRRDERGASSSRPARPRTSTSARARNSWRASSAAPTSSRASASTATPSIAAAVVLRCGSRASSRRRGETAVSVRHHDIRLATEEPREAVNWAGGTVARQVYLGSHRDYLVTLANGEAIRTVAPADIADRKRATGLAPLPAGAMPRARPLGRRQAMMLRRSLLATMLLGGFEHSRRRAGAGSLRGRRPS